MKKEQKESNGEEIDLVALVKLVWERRRFITRVTGVFILIGILFAILSPKEFTAGSTFIPQTETGESNKLGGLASLAGINLGGTGGTSEIPPSLYPQIANSIEFRRTLLKTEITVENNSSTYRDYFENLHSPGALNLIKKYTIGLPRLFLGLFKDRPEDPMNFSDSPRSDFIEVTEQEMDHFKRMEGQMEIIPDKEEGVVELNFTMPEPFMAAEMAKAAEELLQQQIIAFKVKNAREQLKFSQEQFEEKRREFVKKQKELANFRDSNQHISSAMAMNQVQQLETEYNFAFNLYTEMAKQFEQAKLQVSKDTPVFSVINPVSVPLKPSAPNRSLIVVVFGVLGLFVSIGYIFLLRTINSIKKDWKN